MTTREKAIEAMVSKYPEARATLEKTGLFGKNLDNKARKLALKLAGVELPAGMTIDFATPDGWGHGDLGYRAPDKFTSAK